MTTARSPAGLTPAAAASGPRNAYIDALRGAAICSVLLLHFTLAYGLKDSPLGDVLPAWLLRGISLNGNYGVTVFFVVSGFLITSTSLHRWGRLRGVDVRAFYALRAARILPPLCLALALIVALGLLGVPFFTNTDNHQRLPPSFYWTAVGSVLTFWHNVLMQSTGYFNYCLNVYWSLSVEEAFYVALPLVCLLLRRDGLIACLCAAAIVIGPLYRAAHVDDEIRFMYAYPACFDAIAIGVLCALGTRRMTLGPALSAALRRAGALGLLALLLRGIRGHEVFGFSCVALAGAAWVCGAAFAPAMPTMAMRVTAPLRWLGRHSYELYLFHIVVLGLMRNVVTREGLNHDTRLLALAAFFAMSALVAALVERTVSRPANAALRRSWLGRGDVAPAAA